MKKYLSLFLVLVMLMSSMPLNVFAEGVDVQNAEESVSVAAAAEESAEDTKKDTKDEPVKQEPAKEEPVKEEPVKEEPVQEEPVKEEPVQEEPVKEEPVQEEPVKEEPVQEEPVKEEPAQEESAQEEPEQEEPVQEEPEQEEPVQEEPVQEEPAQEEPAQDEPATDEPTGDEPAQDETTGDEEALLPTDDLMEMIPGLPGGGMIEFSSEFSLIDRFTLKEKTSDSVTLTWREQVSASASPADGGFVIDYGYGETPFGSSTMKTESAPAGATSITIDGLEIGNTYYFRISGRYSSETGEYFNSTPVELKTPVTICPYEPEELWVDTYSATSVSMEWTAPEDTSHVTGYMIQWIDSEGNESTPKYQEGAAKTTYRPMGLKVGQTYTFRVYTYYTPEKTTKKILSEKYAENVFTVKLPRPSNLSATATSLKEIKLTWDNVSGATGFQIWRRRGSTGAYEQVGDIKAVDKPKFIDQNDIRAGFTYFYYIVSYCTTGTQESTEIVCSDMSGEVSVIVYPPAPTGVKAVYKSDTEITVTWNAVEDAEGYILEVSDTGEEGTFVPLELKNPLATSYIEKELSVGQTRYYRLKSYVVLGGQKAISENYSAVVYDTTRPLAPENLKLTNGSNNQIRLTWDPSSGADGYQILRSSSADTEPDGALDETTETEWTDRDKKLTYNWTYYYCVRAYVTDVNGIKRVGPKTEVKAIKVKPAAPMILSAKQVEDTATAELKWERVDGATGYYIYAKKDGGAIKRMVAVPGQQDEAEQQKVVTGLTLNAEYEFYVSAYRIVSGKIVEGDKSEPEILAMEFFKPIGLDFTPVNQTSVKLFWNKMYGITGYEIFLECVNDPTQNETRMTTANSLTLTGLDSRNHYRASVRAYVKSDVYEYGEYCDAVEFYTAPVASAKLVLKAANDEEGNSIVNIYWRAVADCDGYIVERAEAKDGPYSVIMEPREGAGNTGYVDRDTLDIGKKYYYRVRAFSRSGMATEYGYVHAGAPVTNYVILPPAQVKNLEAEVLGTTQVQLTWDPVDNAEGYYVYRKKGSGDYLRVGIVNDGSTQFLAQYLVTGAEYTFYVCAYTDTVYGTKSNEVKVRPAPLAPTNVTVVAVNAKSVKLSWDKPYGATSYRVYAQLADGTSKYMMTVTSSLATVTTTVKNLQYDTPYKFTVRAVAKGASGPESEPSEEVRTAIGEITSLTNNYSSSSAIKLKWNLVADVTGYEVHKSTDSGANWTLVGNTKSAEYTVKGLALSTAYSFRVRPYLTIDGTTRYGDWKEVHSFYVYPSKVSNFRFRSCMRYSIRMSWSSMANADGYVVTYWVKGMPTSTKKTMTLEGDLGSGTIYATLSDLNNNTTYQYYVQAMVRPDGGGEPILGARSATLTTKTVR